MKYFIASVFFLMSFNSFSNPTSIQDEWKEVATEDNIIVYTKKSKFKLLPFKAEGIINTNIATVLSILKDHKRKHKWSPKLKTVKIHRKLSENEFIFSEYYKTPWPASDREFLLKGGVTKLSDSKYLLSARSIEDEKLKDTDHVSANVKNISISIEQVSLNQTKVKFEFHGDMKGWMPIWLMNIIQKKWPLRFIQGLRKEAEDIKQIAEL